MNGIGDTPNNFLDQFRIGGGMLFSLRFQPSAFFGPQGRCSFIILFHGTGKSLEIQLQLENSPLDHSRILTSYWLKINH
jgi:hypothetical protein